MGNSMQYEITKEIKKYAKIEQITNKVNLIYQINVKVKLQDTELIETFEGYSTYKLFFDKLEDADQQIKEKEREVEKDAEESIEILKKNLAYLERNGYEINVEWQS